MKSAAREVLDMAEERDAVWLCTIMEMVDRARRGQHSATIEVSWRVARGEGFLTIYEITKRIRKQVET